MNKRRRKKLQQQLTEAAAWGAVSRVERLLRAGADPNWPDADGTTPLYRASVQGMSANVRALVAAGATPDVDSGDDGLPLCAAACHGHDDAVRELLAAGADPDRREDNGDGRTAVEWATINELHSTLELLLQARSQDRRKSSIRGVSS